MSVSNGPSLTSSLQSLSAVVSRKQEGALTAAPQSDTAVAVTSNLDSARAGRIAEVRSQVQKGIYRINTQEVSAKIIDTHLER